MFLPRLVVSASRPDMLRHCSTPAHGRLHAAPHNDWRAHGNDADGGARLLPLLRTVVVR